MSDPVSYLFGQQPNVVQEPNVSSINPTQLSLQSVLSQLIGGTAGTSTGAATSGSPALPYPTQFAAPLTSTQNSLIDQIVGNQGGLTTAANQPINAAQSALTQILSGQPQNFSQYFTNDIAQPMENVFQQQTLPALKAAFAGSAGGTNTVGQNTGYSAAVGQATENLNQQLQQASTALGTQAQTTAQQLQSQGVSQAPGLSSQILSNYFTPATTALSAATLPQQTQQTQLTGQANWANTALNFLSSLFGTGTGLASSGTVQQGNTVVNPGSPGLLLSALDAFAAGAGSKMG